jgi:acetyl esterase/lipase
MLSLATAGAAAQYTPASVRQAMEDMAQAFDPRDLPAVRADDWEVPGPGGPLPLRRYAPGIAQADGPGLLYFHGGMGVFGSVRTHDAVCRMIAAAAPITVLSLDYRLAPEHPFPAALEDAWAALCWSAARAAQLGIAPGRLAIGGDSAGATLAAVTAHRARDCNGPRLAAQLLLCPVTDLCAATPSRSELADGYFPPAALLRWALDLYCPPQVDRCDPRLSPLRAGDLSGLPAAHIHTAQYDPFRDEGQAYAQALAAAGVTVQAVCHEGLTHHFYGMAGAVPAGRAALESAARALRRTLDAGA